MEVWVDIDGYEGRYQVSSAGRVMTVERFKTDGRFQPAKLRKTEFDKDGYEFVILFKDGKYKRHSVHVLVATAFIPNPEKKPQVNHLDGNKRNNDVSNLEWVTGSENIRHAIRTGLSTFKKGDNNSTCKLKDKDVQQIKVLRQNGLNYYQIAEKYGVSFGHIGRIIRGERRA